MLTTKPIIEIIRQRFSCRTYLEQPIAAEKREKLQKFIDSLNSGPFGGQAHFRLVAADKQDSRALKDLGTYGFIQNARGFIIGTLAAGEKNLEDYGYQMEQIILFATSLDLGTCWLGGRRCAYPSRHIAWRNDRHPASPQRTSAPPNQRRPAFALGTALFQPTLWPANHPAGGQSLRHPARNAAHWAIRIEQAALAGGKRRQRLAFLSPAHQRLP
jgi:nitroreductase